MIPKPKKTAGTANEDDDYVDIEDDEDDDDELLDTEDISPEKLQEFLNNKSIQKIF